MDASNINAYYHIVKKHFCKFTQRVLSARKAVLAEMLINGLTKIPERGTVPFHSPFVYSPFCSIYSNICGNNQV